MPSISAECLFVDPIADIAVLGSPDNREQHRQAESYAAQIGALVPFRIGDVPPNSAMQRGWASVVSKLCAT
jgi:hypothetical protein